MIVFQLKLILKDWILFNGLNICDSMILIKLGGSIITNKEKPLAPRKKAIENIAKNLKKINEPIIIVHGGGSFGHYWSVKYDMHTKPKKYDTYGVSIVKNSMIES